MPKPLIDPALWDQAVDADLPSLKMRPRCSYPGCDSTARLRLKFHGEFGPDKAGVCGNHHALICRDCYDHFADEVKAFVADTLECMCGKELHQPSDIILAVIPL